MENPTYLGDGVYARWDDVTCVVMIALSTVDSAGNFGNVIYLDRHVYDNLVMFVDAMRRRKGGADQIPPIEREACGGSGISDD